VLSEALLFNIPNNRADNRRKNFIAILYPAPT